MAKDTQILKGILEGCLLKIIENHETYGYEICEKLMNYGFSDITEGSVYPILIRLEKKENIYSITKKSPLGPMRKYYYLTEKGKEELKDFMDSWEEINNAVKRVLEE